MAISTSFASLPLLDDAQTDGNQRQSNIVNFYQNRSVLITGGSGFIGKMLIEKLLRQCQGIKHLFVLIRPKWNKQPQERLQELLKVPLFDQVKELQHKVLVVEGDVTQANLGLSEQNLLRIMNEVSVIFHSAATVKFDEPLKESIAINITGTKNIIELCRKIPQLAAFVHVSTAYANCDRQEVDEHVYPINMDPERMIELANWLDQDTLQELKIRLLKARPNTYTYTKALAEWLLVKCARDLPVVICRPSIVCASWKEPFPGWIDNVNGPTGIILGTGKGLIRSMYANPDCIADLVPVDIVINLVVALGWFAHVYNDQKHLNDTAESFTESMLDSSSSDSADSLTDETNLIHHNNHHLISLTETDNNNDTSYNNNNNNNNASSTLSYEVTENSKTMELGRDHPHYASNLQLPFDEGYGSVSQTPEVKSVASSLLIKSALVQQDTSSHVRETTCNNLTKASVTSNNSSFEQEQTPLTYNINKTHELQVITQSISSFKSKRRLEQEKQADFDYKLKQFRHNIQTKLSASNLDEEIADVPVFHCTSGDQNPITWGRVQVLIVMMLAIYPSLKTYRYPNGSFTNSKLVDNFYRYTLHYFPGYLVDFITQLCGKKPILVKIFRKFDQAATVLQAFTLREWTFKSNNRATLINELMSEEDKRLFGSDLKQLEWSEYLKNYVLGVRKHMLKEPISTLTEARKSLRLVYYRNLSLQVLFFAIFLYYTTTYTINSFNLV